MDAYVLLHTADTLRVETVDYFCHSIHQPFGNKSSYYFMMSHEIWTQERQWKVFIWAEQQYIFSTFSNCGLNVKDMQVGWYGFLIDRTFPPHVERILNVLRDAFFPSYLVTLLRPFTVSTTRRAIYCNSIMMKKSHFTKMEDTLL